EAIAWYRPSLDTNGQPDTTCSDPWIVLTDDEEWGIDYDLVSEADVADFIPLTPVEGGEQ
ncbi:hypothetical protein, partial [Longimycelium tulufanense]|uniref:hypothetical protein n=1 Tax=Longimycelium tulufanense TaxID=907463 RepID=UPI00166BCA9D